MVPHAPRTQESEMHGLGRRAGVLLVREVPGPAPRGPRLLERVREAIRARHYSPRTEKAYVAWVRCYILFHGKRHPAQMGAAGITAFLTGLAARAAPLIRNAPVGGRT